MFNVELDLLEAFRKGVKSINAEFTVEKLEKVHGIKDLLLGYGWTMEKLNLIMRLK